jgi:alanine racemase
MSTVRGILEQFFRQFEASYEAINTVELSRSALLENFDFLKKLYRAEHVIPVLKSNAYGHGLENVLKILEERDVPCVAVDSYHEALEVRAVSDYEVLVMGPVLPENFNKIETRHISYVIQDMSVLNVLTNSRRSIRIHLEFNTGLNRAGFEVRELRDVINVLRDNPQIELEGVMTQFYDAANPNQRATKAQIREFDDIVAQIKKAGFEPEYVHIAKTNGLTDSDSRFANTIRPGGGLYGINITPQDHPFFEQLEQLKPVLAFYTRIIKLRTLAKGEGVGYEHTFKAEKRTPTAIIPVGYAEGLPAVLSNGGTLRHKNGELPIIGRIAMNHTALNASQTKVKLWDRVEVISPNRGRPNSIRRLWLDFGLYPYDVLVGISADIRRKVVNHHKLQISHGR